VSQNTAPCTRHRNTCLGFNWRSRNRWIHLTGWIDEGAKRPVTRRSRLLVVRYTRCGVSSHRHRGFKYSKCIGLSGGMVRLVLCINLYGCCRIWSNLLS